MTTMWPGVLRMVGFAASWSMAAVLCVATAWAAPIATRNALFEPQPWQQLPGWSDDAHQDALRTFQAACQSLGSKSAWQAACERARSLGDAGAVAARTFFESQFTVYRVEDRGAPEAGLLTGYFEPVLAGRRQRGGAFVFPVYGPPADMFQLDARSIPRTGTRVRLAARGNELVVAADGPITLDVAALGSAPMDQRHRLRLEGQRAVAYWSRQQIESGAAMRAPVLAWVDDANALYVMQVQGSGRIRMPDGKQIRVSYADQNGQPFTPRGTTAGVRTRGIDGDAGAVVPDVVDESVLSDTLRSLVADAPPGDGAAAPATPSTTEVSSAAPTDTPVASPATEGDPAIRTRGIRRKVDDATVEKMVDQLLAQRPHRGAPARGSTATPAVPRAGADSATVAGIDMSPKDASRFALAALAHLVSARRLDRSFVFFRENPRVEGGPRGALGVPLTAGRSIAVDPRVTPLGAPVFIEATRQDGSGQMRRLMFAQDTGGAIRGAVRADFFWGSGPAAGARALQTKDRLLMWVLLPNGLAFGRPSGIRTRGIDDEELPDCVIDDPEFCAR